MLKSELDCMGAQKWIFTQGHVYRLYEVQRSLNQALKVASDLSNSRHVLVRKEGTLNWSVYWRHRKDAISCPISG
ncbi:MAG: hypothetical protein ACW98Y_09280 [Candidatus Thorarchaeota archaeon]